MTSMQVIGSIILDYSMILIAIGTATLYSLGWVERKAGRLGISGDELLARYITLVRAKTRMKRQRQGIDQDPRKR